MGLVPFRHVCFTSRKARNRLIHALNGSTQSLIVRVSNVTSAVGKALPIMHLAKDGFHLLSETKHDFSISKRLCSEPNVFLVTKMYRLSFS